MKEFLFSIILLSGCSHRVRVQLPTPAQWRQTTVDTWVLQARRDDLAEILYDGVVYWSFKNGHKELIGVDVSLEAAERRAEARR